MFYSNKMNKLFFIHAIPIPSGVQSYEIRARTFCFPSIALKMIKYLFVLCPFASLASLVCVHSSEVFILVWEWLMCVVMWIFDKTWIGEQEIKFKIYMIRHGKEWVLSNCAFINNDQVYKLRLTNRNQDRTHYPL